MIIKVDSDTYKVVEPSQGVRNWLQSVLSRRDGGAVAVGLDLVGGGEMWMSIETLRRAVLVVGHE